MLLDVTAPCGLHIRIAGLCAPYTGVAAGWGTQCYGFTTRMRGVTLLTAPDPVPASSNRLHLMNIIIWLVVGGVIGWVASLIMRTDAQQGILLNVIVGIVGSFLGGWFLSPLFGVSTINQSNFSIAGLLVSLLGAVVLLAIVNLIRRGTTR
jgi:uncharacterized membrane protein YeaQ/YmgE (transglycosylase-associated protein family)